MMDKLSEVDYVPNPQLAKVFHLRIQQCRPFVAHTGSLDTELFLDYLHGL